MAQSANPAFACPVTLMNGLFDVCSSFMIWLCVGGEKKKTASAWGKLKRYTDVQILSGICPAILRGLASR